MASRKNDGQMRLHASSPSAGQPLRSRENTRALPRHARAHNRSLVVRVLYHSGPLSRAELARATGLAKVTVSDLIVELMDGGYAEELGIREVTGPGKPAILVDLARDAHRILAVDLSNHHCFRGALLDIDANVKHRAEVQRHGQRGEAAVQLLCSLIEELIDAADRPILGIGVGTPGIVTEDGTVALAQNLDWHDVPLQAKIAEKFDLPVVVRNDANLAALGEHLYGDSTDNFLLLTIGHGIGAGIMLDGTLVRGAHDSVGEIGVVMVGTAAGFDSAYNPEYTLEHWLSMPALERRWEGKDASEREEILKSAGRMLGVALAPIVATFDLSEIVLTGPAEAVNDTLAEVTQGIVERRILPGTQENLLVRTSSKGEDIVFLGCVAQVLSTFLGVS